MKDIWYEELRKNCSESAKLTAEQMGRLTRAVNNVLVFHKLAVKEGLLCLEEACKTLDMESEDKFFAELIMFMADGANSMQLLEYGLNRYFTANFTGCEGLIYMIYLKGALMIEENEDPCISEKILESMLPENVRLVYTEKKRNEAERVKKAEQEKLRHKIGLICNNKKADERGYTLLSEASLIFESRSDRDIKRILREVDCWALAVAMNGLSGNACKRIFDNMSDKVAAAIIEYMESMPSVKLHDIYEDVIKIVNVVIRLAKEGEISDYNMAVLKIVTDIYNSYKEACFMH